mgnify:CR=1 FL=1|tara:strand:- start:2516 stop:2839 length:324 start_codon:yes stop_codon:yes gene_type:complete
MKYEITITDKQTWITPREKRDIDTEDRFEVVVEADSEDKAKGIATEMLLDYQFDVFTSEHTISEEGCNWWKNSMLNSDSDWGKANEIYGDELEFDGGTIDYLMEEIE